MFAEALQLPQTELWPNHKVNWETSPADAQQAPTAFALISAHAPWLANYTLNYTLHWHRPPEEKNVSKAVL